MKKAVVIIGIGEMGGVFARGFLKAGHPVYPIGRSTDSAREAAEIDSPEVVIIAVAEKDLHGVLKTIPEQWRHRLLLLQNELLPRDWQTHRIENPTVISVWFEKKSGQDVKVLIPSPVFGPRAGLVQEALGAINISTRELANEDQLLFELILKNLYILTVNIAGLEVGGNVGELWTNHQKLAREVAGDIMDIQFRMVGKELDREKLIQGMVAAFNGDLKHQCMGRFAPARLKRAIDQAQAFNIGAKRLKQIYKDKVMITV